MLTTTVDGIWVLQALTGIEVLAPELGLRPLLPRAEPASLALAHPLAAELKSAGVIDGSGCVTATVREWLTVVSRRDVALFVQLRAPDSTNLVDNRIRVAALLARFAQWWVLMERSHQIIRLSGVGRTRDQDAAHTLIGTQIARLCGQNRPAQLRPVTLPAEVLQAPSRKALRDNLLTRRLDLEQLQLLMLATDPCRSAQASIIAIQSGVTDQRSTRSHIEPGSVTIIDTPAGRVTTEQVISAGKRWVIVAPGAPSNIAAAIGHMLQRLPASHDWHSYRKAV